MLNGMFHCSCESGRLCEILFVFILCLKDINEIQRNKRILQKQPVLLLKRNILVEHILN